MCETAAIVKDPRGWVMRPDRRRPNLDEALATLRACLPELRERWRVRSLAVFGSYVRGEQRRGSDLDVLVEFDEAPSLFQYVDLQDYLGEALGVKVDLVMKSALRPGIGERIQREAVPV